MIKTCLADDHKLFCEGLERLLNDSGHFQILRKFYNGFRILEDLPFLSPDLLVIDIEMPGASGLDMIKRIKLINPQVKIAILTMHEESTYVKDAHLLGADGYLSKSSESEYLIDCLLRICNGEPIFPDIPQNEEDSPLSEREEEILKLITRGKTNEEAGEMLNISPLTIKAHRRNIVRKLKVKNFFELISKAKEKGFC